ncbi:MAG: tetratricopeptide repeat protein [Planctomycetes bacterium]|nr:tetratricopeptide repeat protein [Planctomycetota bacterium]
MGESKRALARGAIAADASAARALPLPLVWGGFALLLLAVYGPALHGGLLWDDPDFVPKPAMRGWDGLFRIWFEHGAIKQYYPLTYSAFWFEHRLFGDDTLGYHVVNVVLHAFNATLVWRILRRLAVPGALFAAALFAFHPVHVESVAWICELKNTLSGAFYLSALFLALAPAEDAAFLPMASRRWWSVLLLFFGAVLSKAVTATFPAALLVVLWFRDGKLAWRRHVLLLTPFFALALAAGGFSAWMERTQVGAEGPAFDLDVLDRVVLAGRALCFYAGKLVWPADLVFTYPRWTIDAAEALAWVFPAACVLVAAASFLLRARLGRGPLAALCFFAGTLFPALGFVDVFPFLYSFVADHFQYLASLGPLALLAAGSSVLARRVPLHAGRAAAAVVVSVLAFLAWREAHEYSDVETLYRTTLAENPASWMAHSNLGVELAKAGKHAEAIEHYRAALALDPDLHQTRFNLANALKAHGELDAAIAEYERALATNPRGYEVENNLALALDERGDADGAVAHFEQSIELEPRFATAHYNLGALHSRRNELERAEQHLARAVELAPDYAAAWNALGIVYAKREQIAEALPRFERAVKLDPGNAEARNNLGLALGKRGELEAAERQFREALRLKPDYANARGNLERTLKARAKGGKP